MSMLKLDDGDLMAIAKHRARGGKLTHILLGLMCVFGFAAVCSAWLSPSTSLYLVMFCCMVICIIIEFIIVSKRRGRIFKTLQEEYIESSKS